MLDALQFYFPHFISQKRKQGIFSRVITYDCPEMRKYKKEAPKKYINMKFIKQKINMTKVIYGDKVAFLTFRERNSIGIIINNKEITETEKVLFNQLWKVTDS